MVPFLIKIISSSGRECVNGRKKISFLMGAKNSRLTTLRGGLFDSSVTKASSYALPKKFGGVRERVQARDLCVIREELARGWALADTMFAVQALGSYPIALFGTEEQKQRYLPPLRKGPPSPPLR